MNESKNFLDEYDRNQLVVDMNVFCDNVDCDTDCPLKKEKMCHYPDWDLVSDDELINVTRVIALDYGLEDNTEITVEEKEKEEDVTNPEHYQTNAMECIDEMVVVFGKKAVINFCNLNAWKYRYRSDHKGGKDDLEKADWYLKKSLELQISSNQILDVDNKYNPKQSTYDYWKRF